MVLRYIVRPAIFHMTRDGVDRDKFLSTLLADGAGSTGETFQALISYMRVKQPPVVQWENVPELLDPKYDHMGTFVSLAAEVGYVMSCRTVNSLNYFNPQRRVRVYGVCLNVAKSGLGTRDAQLACENMMRLAERLRGQEADVVPLADFLLPASDKYIAEELQRRKEVKAKNMERGPEVALWRRDLMTACTKKGIRMNALRTPEHFKKSPWWQTLCAREQQGATFHLMQDDDLTMVDVSQSILRMGKSTDAILNTLLPGAHILMKKAGAG